MERIYYASFLLGAVFCVYRSIVPKKILSAAIYLACINALVYAVIYMLGAAQVAVIELSVGAGLVTVLLVFAVGVGGDDTLDLPSLIPKPLDVGVIGLVSIVLGWMAYPATPVSFERDSMDLATSMWQSRVLDAWIQMALIFSGVMGVLGLLSEKTPGRTEESWR